MNIDDATWFALATSLTAVGAVITFFLWRARGAAAGLRALAFTLLPYAAYFTHTLRLIGQILSEIGDWAVHFVFSPVVWFGVVLAGLSVVLFGVSSVVRRRSPGRPSRRARKTPEVTGGTSRKPAAPPAAQDDDMADIEAILKKHGIS